MGKKNLWNLDRLEKLAKELDLKDKLKKFKSEFIYPDDKLYFDGNSLGMLSKQTKEALKKVINDEWGQNLISSWNNSWINLPLSLIHISEPTRPY